VRRDGDGVRRVDLRHFVDGDHVRDVVETRTAQLLGPRYAEQSELTHLLDVLPRKLGALVQLRCDGRDFLAREGPHHLAHREVLLGEIESIVHERRSCRLIT
jgi:hypothetical protein